MTSGLPVPRLLFGSFDRDQDDRVSQWAVLSRLQGCGLGQMTRVFRARWPR
jgi:hypothetical protein